MDERSVRERFQEVRQLEQDYGAIEAIPEEQLENLSYIRVTETDGTVRVLPAEKLATESLTSGSIASEREQRLPPFARLTMQVEASGGFRNDIKPNRLRNELSELTQAIDPYEHDGYSVGWLPHGHPVNEVANKLDHASLTKGPNIIFSIENVSGDWLLSSVASKAAQDLITAFRLPLHPHSNLSEALMAVVDTQTSEDFDYHEFGRTTIEDAEKIWTILERLKSQLTDIETLEAYFAERFSESFVDIHCGSDSGSMRANDIGEADLIEVDVHTEDLGEDKHPAARYLYSVSHEVGFSLQVQSMCTFLESKGFNDVAALLKDCKNIGEMRSVVAQALVSNTQLDEYKTREKDLKMARRAMTEETDIHEFNRELHELKDTMKADMRHLRGLHGYLNMPTLYAEAISKQISEIQNRLTKRATDSFDVVLDPKFDSSKDTNPGAISGDCTDGRPLPFGTKIPAFNVKILKGTKHVGNIYLLKSTTEDNEPAWHLDAVQYPSFAVNWEKFPATLISTLATEAQKSNVKYITINEKPYLISNYDYIARGFLKHLGIADTSSVTYDQMELPEAEEMDVKYGSAVKHTRINFPDISFLSGKYQDFQGNQDNQIVLWENPKI